MQADMWNQNSKKATSTAEKSSRTKKWVTIHFGKKNKIVQTYWINYLGHSTLLWYQQKSWNRKPPQTPNEGQGSKRWLFCHPWSTARSNSTSWTRSVLRGQVSREEKQQPTIKTRSKKENKGCGYYDSKKDNTGPLSEFPGQREEKQKACRWSQVSVLLWRQSLPGYNRWTSFLTTWHCVVRPQSFQRRTPFFQETYENVKAPIVFKYRDEVNKDWTQKSLDAKRAANETRRRINGLISTRDPAKREALREKRQLQAERKRVLQNSP